MNKRFRMSPGAPSLVLIVVVLSMSIMGMLMFIRTQNDQRLSDRSILVARTDAVLMEKAEETFAGLDNLVSVCKNNTETDDAYLLAVEDALPEGMEMVDRTITWQEKDQGRVLYVSVSLCSHDAPERIVWQTRRLYAEYTEVESLWNEF